MRTSDLIKLQSLCCGCSACANICPQKAITITFGEGGALFPKINSEVCIDCKKCIKVCPLKNESKYYDNINCYAAISNDRDLLRTSASGGVFSSIAKKVLEKEWYISGAINEFTEGECDTHHILCNSFSQMPYLQGSKYVQSDMKDIFSQIKAVLDKNEFVLFSGTPCQVDALYHYLQGRSVEKLFTIDIICHGVPGNKLFNGYIKILEEYLNGTIRKIDFRNKELSGWGLKGIIEYYSRKGKKKRALLLPSFSSYYRLFLDSAIYRESCYNCKYARLNRVSDMTIGDYWGIEEEDPEVCKSWKASDGISCILINTPKGQDLFMNYSDYLNFKESSLEKVIKHNGQLLSPSKRAFVTDRINNIMVSDGYKAVENLCYNSKIKKMFVSLWYRLPFCFQVKLTNVKNSFRRKQNVKKTSLTN